MPKKVIILIAVRLKSKRLEKAIETINNIL